MRLSCASLVLAGLLSTCAMAQAQLQPPPLVPSRPTNRVKALYPATAKAAHVTGDVVVSVKLDRYGNVTQCTILSGPEMLRSAAIDAAKQWAFSPSENNESSNMHYTIVFKFHDLNSSTSD